MLTESTRDVFYSCGLKSLSEAAAIGAPTMMGSNRQLNQGSPTRIEDVGMGQDRIFAKA